MNFNRIFSVTALALMIASGGAFAQVKRKPTPSPKQNRSLPHYKYKATPSRLTVMF